MQVLILISIVEDRFVNPEVACSIVLSEIENTQTRNIFYYLHTISF
jgi:hypothetical protein